MYTYIIRMHTGEIFSRYTLQTVYSCQCESCTPTPPGLRNKFCHRKCFFVKIPTLTWTFSVKFPSPNIYISTICNVRMSESTVVVKIPCHLRSMSESWGWSDSVTQVSSLTNGNVYHYLSDKMFGQFSIF